ncbi:ABC transporter ATP-binding protein [Halalkalibacter urbisdiaboli]|uniref:ABC transporter ATP-binding protein n=1 Tax=Halalkalibacter urbisdiaboli TaxID=1960589 RepID=UPI000B4317DE|nr:ABC transporter ATP-binding protein [Halalkalibacter urbisdiaboli]
MSEYSSQTGSKAIRQRTVYVWTLSFLRPYAFMLCLLIFCGFVVTGVELAIPKFIQYFIDSVLAAESSKQFMVLIGLIALLVLLTIAFTAVRNLTQRSLQERASRDMQFAIYTHLRKLGFAYFEKHPIGESLSLMNTEVASLQQLYRLHFPGMINGLIFSLISIILMATISLKLSLILIPSFFLYYLFGPYLERKASINSKKLATERIHFNQKIYESIASLADLRANAAEAWDLERVKQQHRQLNDRMITTYWFAFWRGTNRRMSYYIGGIAIIIYGVHLSQIGELSTGAFVAFLLYYFQTMHILTVVVTSITEQKVLMNQAEKLYRFLKLTPLVTESAQKTSLPTSNGLITFDQVSFQYTDGPKVLDKFELTVNPGEKVALVGASGNGKSTVLKLIGRFYDPTDGAILLDRIPIQELSFQDLRANLGFVFQETYLFGASVRDNILFGCPDASFEEVVAAAKGAYAHDFICELPQGYDTLLGERGVKLSGGQKQRISIARMFIKNPPIILLDEATASLDTISEKEVQAALQLLMEGRTTITVAHRLSTIKDYNKIVLIEKGRVLEMGTFEELMMREGAFYQLAAGKALEGA